MRRLAAATALLALGLPLYSAGADISQPDDPKLLPSLVQQSSGNYTKLGDQVYQVSYTGKSIPRVDVRIFAAGGGVFFFADIMKREQVPLSKNLLLKIVELNSTFDYVKIVLSDKSLTVRIDARAANLSVKEFQVLEADVAAAADSIFGSLKDFLP